MDGTCTANRMILVVRSSHSNHISKTFFFYRSQQGRPLPIFLYYKTGVYVQAGFYMGLSPKHLQVKFRVRISSPITIYFSIPLSRGYPTFRSKMSWKLQYACALLNCRPNTGDIQQPATNQYTLILSIQQQEVYRDNLSSKTESHQHKQYHV